MRPAPAFEQLIAAATTSAVHLEMRDVYEPDAPEFLHWEATGELRFDDENREWEELVRATVARGVRVRRARVVSEPVTSYIRYEHVLTTPHNVAAGEEVRWLPRRQASDLALPGNDCWVFDSQLVRVHHFAGDGTILDQEITDAQAVVKLYTSAFEAVWERAIPHERYQPS